MTPGDWALLQQWDSACRCLMLLHPWHGLEQTGLLLGNWQSGLQPGWNMRRRDSLAEHETAYTFIGDSFGETFSIVPPPEDAGAVRDVTRLSPPLQNSRLWSVVCELGEAAVRRGLRSRTDVDRIKGAIERAARSLRNEERVKSSWRDAMARMRAALQGSRGGVLS
jgi:hypothetical protein